MENGMNTRPAGYTSEAWEYEQRTKSAMTDDFADTILTKTFAGKLNWHQAERLFEAVQIRGGFTVRKGKVLSYTGYDYANQRWIERSA